VAIHIGSEIRKRLKTSGIPITRFAKRVGCSAKTVHAIFKRPSIDTMLLKKCSEVLAYDFFKLYTDELVAKRPSTGSDQVAEPAAEYGSRSKNDNVEIIIRPGQDKDLLQLMLRVIEQQSKKRG
jgi:hypothetical protein